MAAVETRNLARDSLFLLAEMRPAGHTDAIKVRVRNLSPGGMMAEGDMNVQHGDKVMVEFRTIGEIEGSVAWLQGNRCGIAFVQEIDPKQARAPVSQGSAPIVSTPPEFQSKRTDTAPVRKI